MQNRYTSFSTHQAEEFNTASRSVKPGLIAAGIVVAAISGMNVYAACFLIPLVVAAYVIAGGLRSTFIADYTHTVVLFIAIFVFAFLIYATSDLVGSPSRLYDLLLEASKTMPISRNTEGSYLAFRSVDGLVFAIDLFAAGFSTVWLDQAYWQVSRYN
ncbi:hypothetical protein LTR28_009068 [Elasticomyces elasticus]|nr:hypothetical protein LTR28_009068 [Elasticomyces elasticus]